MASAASTTRPTPTRRTEELEPHGVLGHSARRDSLAFARPAPGRYLAIEDGEVTRLVALHQTRDPPRARLLGRPAPRGPERLAPPRGHRRRRRRRADPRRPQRQRHLRQRRPRDRRASCATATSSSLGRVALIFRVGRRLSGGTPAPNGGLHHDVWSRTPPGTVVTPDPGEAGTMRRRWWLVAVVFVVSMGMTGLPAGAQLPAPVPTPPVPDATGHGADRSRRATGAGAPVPTPAVPTPAARFPSRRRQAPAPGALRRRSASRRSPSPPLRRRPSARPRERSSTSTPSVAHPGAARQRRARRRRVDRSRRVRLEPLVRASWRLRRRRPRDDRLRRYGPAGSTPGSATSPGSGATGADGQTQRSGSSNAKPKSRAARVQHRERALRRTVLRFHGCLSRVPRSERRVLSLRAGVGRLRPHTRSEVARITHLRRARVISLERHGLRRLRALDRAGACQDAGGHDDRGDAGARYRHRRCRRPAAPASAAPSWPSITRAPRARTAARRASRSGAELSISRPSTSSPGGSSFDLALVLGPLAFLAFLLVITREVRRTELGDADRRRDRLKLRVAELELGGAQRIGDGLRPARAGDRDHRRAQREQPRQRDLLRRDAVGLAPRPAPGPRRRPRRPPSRCRPAATTPGRRCRARCTPAPRPWRSVPCSPARAGSARRRCRRSRAPPRAGRRWRWRCRPSGPCPRPGAP